MVQFLARLNTLIDTLITKLNWLNTNKQGIADPIAATRLTGTIDIARLPVIPSGNTVVSSGDMTALTAPQQTDIAIGTTVILADGRSFRYSGTGSKTLEASYIYVADRTPDWSTVSGKPTTVAGYGITDAVSTGAMNTALATYVNGGAAQSLTAPQQAQARTNIGAADNTYDPGDLSNRLVTGLSF